MREFSLTSVNDIVLKMEKNGGEYFEFKVGQLVVKLTWVQLEMLRLGCGDISDAELKKKPQEV